MLVLVVPKILADEAVRLQFCSYLVVGGGGGGYIMLLLLLLCIIH